jgi:hypothetical protein
MNSQARGHHEPRIPTISEFSDVSGTIERRNMTKQTHHFEATITAIAVTRNISTEELASQLGMTHAELGQ